LLSNYYFLLADATLPHCQVEEQKPSRNKHINNLSKINIKTGVLNNSIPSIIADSAATLNIGTKKDKALFILTCRTSDKVFQPPNRTRTAGDTISELPCDICQPAKDIHIVPTITKNSLLSIPWIPDTSPYLTMKKSTYMIQE
jgi:hypothetical protein